MRLSIAKYFLVAQVLLFVSGINIYVLDKVNRLSSGTGVTGKFSLFLISKLKLHL